MKAEGSAVTGGTYTEGHIALPQAVTNRRGHAEQTRKPTGLDWSTTTPACTSCGTRTSALNRDDQCTTCAPRPRATTSSVVEKREPARPRTPRKRRQYQRPIGPRRARGTASRARVDEGALIAAYRDGSTVPTLAERFEIMPATGSGGANRLPDQVRADVVRLYAEGLSKSKVAAELGIGMTTVSRIMADAGVVGRTGQGGRADGAAPLKARIAALATTPREINRWALDTGLVEIPKPGIPSTSVVDAWEAAHPERTSE